jgi:ABC-type dipeptide/oligopeptide/nickel transport system permease component
MIRFLLRRFSIFPFAILLSNFIGFAFAFSVAPIVLSSNPYSRGQIGLPPIFPAYWQYLQAVFRGDFGTTFTGESVLSVILRFGPASLGLIGIALILSIAIGVSLGRLAVRQGKPGVAPWLTVISTVGLASPSFYIAVLLIVFFLMVYLYTDLGRVIPFQGFGWDLHLVLPTLALMIQPTVKIAQVTGGLLSEELERQYVTAALSFGHPFRKIKRKFAFRSILASVLLTIAASLRIMVAELVIIERLFNWPGVGRLIASTLTPGTAASEFLAPPMVAALLAILVAIFLLTDFIAMFLARMIDPRMRVDVETEEKRGSA